MSENQEPLPCPLCGSGDLLLRNVGGWELDCRGCDLSLVLTDDPTRTGLIARWNKRPALSAKDKELRQARADTWDAAISIARNFNQSGRLVLWTEVIAALEQARDGT